MDWNPIETAPKDGTPILLWLEAPLESNAIIGYAPWKSVQVVIGWWGYGGDWIICFMDEGSADSDGRSSSFFMGEVFPLRPRPTSWQSLPSPPTPA